MDKGAKDKLTGSPGENGGGQDAQKIFTQGLEGTRRRGRPRKGWREEVERFLQVLGVRRWRELVIDREKFTIFTDNRKQYTETVISLVHLYNLGLQTDKYSLYLEKCTDYLHLILSVYRLFTFYYNFYMLFVTIRYSVSFLCASIHIAFNIG